MNIKELFKNFIIKNTQYTGVNFYIIYKGKTYIETSLQKIIDKVISEEDFFNDIR